MGFFRFCRRFLYTGARIYIWLRHVRTRWVVFIWISGYWWDPSLNSSLWVSPDCMMHSNSALLETGRQSSISDSATVFDFATTRSSSPGLSCCFLPLQHCLNEAGWAAMARCKLRNVHDVEQTEKVVPFITGGIAFRQNIGKLAYGINIFDLDFGVQVESVK